MQLRRTVLLAYADLSVAGPRALLCLQPSLISASTALTFSGLCVARRLMKKILIRRMILHCVTALQIHCFSLNFTNDI